MAATADLPLKNELDLVKYFREITGTSSSSASNKVTPGVATASQAARLGSDELSNIMTEWLRGNGKFLENMQNQNQSGLYNTSTRQLVANDLTAQAALKAAGANQDIDKVNAQLATNASIANAQEQTKASSANSKVTKASTKDSALNLALAAGTSLVNSYLKGDKKSEKSGQITSGTSFNPYEDAVFGGSGGAAFDFNFNSSKADSDFLLNGLQGVDSASFLSPSYDFGTSFLGGENSFDLGSLLGNAASNFSLPDTSVFDFGQGGIDTSGVSFDFGDMFDFGSSDGGGFDFGSLLDFDWF